MPNELKKRLLQMLSHKKCRVCGYEGVMKSIELRSKSTTVWIVRILIGLFFLQGAVSMLNGWGSLGTVGNTLATFLYIAIGAYLIFPKYVKECPECHAIHGINSYLGRIGYSQVEAAGDNPTTKVDHSQPFERPQTSHAKQVAKELGKGMGIVAILAGVFFLYIIVVMAWFLGNP